MSSFIVKYPKVASVGFNVSHAKNRTKRAYKYNLQTVTLVDKSGKRIKMKLPARLIRTMKKHGVVQTYSK
ncbi:50S ribosomal protein L28 [bacterium]|nr:50S ribosomal protein L28 [bacterium]